MHASANREIKNKLRPIFDQIHSLLVAARSIIPVIALQGRTHGQEIFDYNCRLARVGILQGASVLRKQRQNLRVHPAKLMFVDGNSYKYVGYALVAERVSRSVAGSPSK